jgi:hypothetical protein
MNMMIKQLDKMKQHGEPVDPNLNASGVKPHQIASNTKWWGALLHCLRDPGWNKHPICRKRKDKKKERKVLSGPYNLINMQRRSPCQ